MANASVKKIHELLKMQLSIPEYQRPYKWTRRNMADLLEDMDEAIAVGREFAKPDSSYAYRIGTIILHKKGKKYDIVDGQQRIISLLLLSRFLHNNVDMPYNFVEEVNLANKDTQEHLRDNYLFISDWFGTKSSKKDIRKEFIKSYVSIFEAVVITVENLREAFQLFDSQNSRGRSLNPSDLLKAYHLRVMRDKLQIQRDVEKWGKIDYKRINTLLSTYLYRIINWSDRRKVSPFTKNDIDVFKGMPSSSDYAYVRRTAKAMPIFQINEPFISGHDFFAMIDHYLTMLDYIRSKLYNDETFMSIKTILENNKWKNNTGFKHANLLFECAVLCYYDRFHNLDFEVVKKLFKWSFMLRIDRSRLGGASINCYAIGEDGHNYSNEIAIFFEISHARLHKQVAQRTLNILKNGDIASKKEWEELYESLKNI